MRGGRNAGPLREIETIELGYNYEVTDAGLEHLKSMKKLKTLYLYRSGVTGTGFQYLARLPQLQSVSLSHSKLDDRGLEHLARLPHLTWLRLDHTDVSDAGLKHLHALAKLTDVTLMGTKVTADGVAKLQQALPNCQIAFKESPREMSDTPLFPDHAKPTATEIQEAFNRLRTPNGYGMTGVVVTNEGDGKAPVIGLLLYDVRISPHVLLKLIQNQLPDLRKLSLEGQGVRDEFAESICGLTLEFLTINRCLIADEALRHLARMQNLEDLDLRNNNDITDAGLIHLQSLTKLRSLKLGYTGATPAGVERLKQALPNCEVTW